MKARHLRIGRREAEPETVPCDFVPETEADSARRYWREFLRENEAEEPVEIIRRQQA